MRLKLKLGPRSGIAPPTSGVPLAGPGVLWNGTSGSGGAAPVDPSHTGPQGILRLVTVPNVLVSDGLLVGVRGGCFEGYNQILCHVEGNIYDVTEQSRESYVDVNGNTQWITGNFVKLDLTKFPEDVFGEIAVYFEAIPNNPGILKKVLGPFRYFRPDPADPKSNRVILFGSSYPNDSTPGGPYKNLTAALTYARSQAFWAPEVRCMDTGEYTINGLGGRNLSGTRIAITAAEGVTCTIVKPDQTDFTGIRPTFNGLEFRGSNVIYDQKNIFTLWWETNELSSTPHAQGTLNGTVANQHHFNGCVVTNSMGRYPLWRGYTVGEGIARGNALYTECTVSRIRGDKCFQSAGLVRNNICSELPADVFVLANCVIGNRLQDCKIGGYYANDVTARVSYTGAGSATLQRIGSANGGTSNDYTLRLVYNGTTTDIVIVKGPGFATMQSLADQVNALPGWNFENLYNSNWTHPLDRSTMAMSINGSGIQGGAFGPVAVTSTPLDIVTSFNIHADGFQAISGSTNLEKINCVYVDNIGFDMNWQFFLIQSTTTTKAAQDWLIENNCSHLNTVGIGTLLAQVQVWGYHLLINHNTLPNQLISFNGQSSNPVSEYKPDGFCEFYGNVAGGLEVTPAASDVGYGDRNYIINSPQGAGIKPSNTVTGGSMATIINSAETGDFKPIGSLSDESNLITPKAPFDVLGNRRSSLDARGAVSIAA